MQIQVKILAVTLCICLPALADSTSQSVTSLEQRSQLRQKSSNQMMTATAKQRLSTKGQDNNRVNDCRVDEKFRQGKVRETRCKHERVTQHLEQ